MIMECYQCEWVIYWSSIICNFNVFSHAAETSERGNNTIHIQYEVTKNNLSYCSGCFLAQKYIAPFSGGQYIYICLWWWLFNLFFLINFVISKCQVKKLNRIFYFTKVPLIKLCLHWGLNQEPSTVHPSPL